MEKYPGNYIETTKIGSCLIDSHSSMPRVILAFLINTPDPKSTKLHGMLEGSPSRSTHKIVLSVPIPHQWWWSPKVWLHPPGFKQLQWLDHQQSPLQLHLQTTISFQLTKTMFCTTTPLKVFSHNRKYHWSKKWQWNLQRQYLCKKLQLNFPLCVTQQMPHCYRGL